MYVCDCVYVCECVCVGVADRHKYEQVVVATLEHSLFTRGVVNYLIHSYLTEV